MAHARGMLVRHPLRADRIQGGASERRPNSSEADPQSRPADRVRTEEITLDIVSPIQGGRTTPHRLSDFEDVRRTKLVGEKTRRQLTAMPVQSRPSQVGPEVAERRPDKQDDAEGQQVAEQVATTGSVPRKVGP